MRLTASDWYDLFGFHNRMAAQCYANEESSPMPSSEIPGGNIMTRSEGSLGYHDMWFTGTNGNLGVSAGNSILSFDQVPVWVLQYSGWYDKKDERVLKVLKEALLAGYTKDESQGGRGPDMFFSQDRVYTYENTIHYKRGLNLPDHFQTEPWDKSGLMDFSGHELIWRKDETGTLEVFRHELLGFALVN